MTLTVVALGGAIGAVSRYLVGGWVQGALGSAYPWGTWAVNVVGSLLLGFAMVWLTQAMAAQELRQFVVMGFLGSFTTFSTFSFETVEMLRDGLWVRAGIYSVGSVVLGVTAVALGALAAGWLTRTPV
jgi:CrcB protein